MDGGNMRGMHAESPIASLENGLPTLRGDLAEGYTLPASWYSDPAILARELDAIFAHSWQYAARTEQLSCPGDFVASRAAHIPVVVTRDTDGTLNAFVNVCRHRGHEVAAGSGNRQTLQCPYHAWTYGLDGCLRSVPRLEREPDLPVDELSLVPVQVDTWGPFVFVNPDLRAGPLAEALGPVPGMVEELGFDIASLEYEGRTEWEIEANWKVSIENYLECYHCPTAHPGFTELLDVHPDAYRLSAERLTASQRAPLRPEVMSGERSAAYDPTGGTVEAQYHLLWPNFTINVEPGAPNIGVDVWWPDGPGRTVGVSDRWFGADVPRETRDAMVAFGLQVAAEDTGLCESVHRGLSSGMIAHGRLMRESEPLIAHFQSLVLESLAGPPHNGRA